MTDLDLRAVMARYSRALDAKPGKGAITADGIAAITDSVADVPDLLAEVEQLTRWKTEALPVMDGLQELGRALGLPLGTRITGPDALAEVRRLRDLTDQDALTREAIRVAAGSGSSIETIVAAFKEMRDNEWMRRALQHRARAEAAEALLDRLLALVSDWQANGNSRELGDLRADVWQACARQLLETLNPDGAE